MNRLLRRVASTIRELVEEVVEDGAVDAAASVAFWLLLSLPAAILAGLASLSLLGDEVTEELRRVTLEFVDRVFTSEADELRATINSLFDQNSTGLFSVSILLAIVTSTRGFAGLIRALDVVYDVEESRGFVRIRLVSLGFVFGTIAAVGVSAYLWTLSGSLGVPFWIRVTMAVVVLVIWAATIFHLGPNHHTPWRYDLPGAVLTAVGWFAVSFGYALYIRIAGGGNQVVGIAGALLLGVTWFWLVCLVLLIGGELNEILASRAGVVSENRWIRPRLRRLRAMLRPRDAGAAADAGVDDDVAVPDEPR